MSKFSGWTTSLRRLTSCALVAATVGWAAPAIAAADSTPPPYDPIVYHLDLSILAYQLYGQSLVWPFDPYYEELNDLQWSRSKMVERVRAWAEETGKAQRESGARIDDYRGPGALSAFDNNPAHDPIIYQYSRLYPWSSTISNADGKWTEYLTPAAITDRIAAVHVCYRTAGQPEGTVSVTRLPDRRNGAVADARDVLLAFEGGTGDKGEPGQPASQSLMGFVLLRSAPTGESYDVHIAFRGSRSGSSARAALQANFTSAASGNPDWITDLGYNLVEAPQIATTGLVSRGMARSMRSLLPQLMHCLEQVAVSKAGVLPGNIYVTGHSLGGALAQHFTSAMLMGDDFGPTGQGQGMPAALKAWPWPNIKLITFSAPRVGEEAWARKLTTRGLDSDFFTNPLNPYDANALTAPDPSIAARLADTERPAAFRVLVPNDPVTGEKVPGGKHVGKTLYARPAVLLQMPETSAHEPELLRRLLVEALPESRIPPIAWRYRDLMEMSPERDSAARGSPLEYDQLSNAVRRYYEQPGRWFDRSSFDRNFEVFRNVLSEK